MKTLLILLMACSTARANLIDLTPGGFDTNKAPPAFAQFLNQWGAHEFEFFDEATTKGWISQYGILNGGTYFFTSLIGNPGQTSTVSWDFGSLPGWSMSRILVEGIASNGSYWDNIYSVPRNLREFDSLERVLIGHGVTIHDIGFFGRFPGSPQKDTVPDSGSTLILFAMAFCTLTGLYTGIVIGKT